MLSTFYCNAFYVSIFYIKISMHCSTVVGEANCFAFVANTSAGSVSRITPNKFSSSSKLFSKRVEMIEIAISLTSLCSAMLILTWITPSNKLKYLYSIIQVLIPFKKRICRKINRHHLLNNWLCKSYWLFLSSPVVNFGILIASK